MKKRHLFLNLWDLSSDRKTFIARLDDLYSEFIISSDDRDRFELLFRGLQKLIREGLPSIYIKNHPKLFEIIITSGLQISNLARINGEYLFLGSFIDIQINTRYGDWSFYQLVCNAISKIKNGIVIFNDKLKEKIITRLFNLYPERREKIEHLLFNLNLNLAG